MASEKTGFVVPLVISWAMSLVISSRADAEISVVLIISTAGRADAKVLLVGNPEESLSRSVSV